MSRLDVQTSGVEVVSVNAMEWGVLIFACCVLSAARPPEEAVSELAAMSSITSEVFLGPALDPVERQDPASANLPSWNPSDRWSLLLSRSILPDALPSEESRGLPSLPHCEEAPSGLASPSFCGVGSDTIDAGVDRQDSVLLTVTLNPPISGQPDVSYTAVESLWSITATATPGLVVRFLVAEDDGSVVPQYWYTDPAVDLDVNECVVEVVALGVLEGVSPETKEPQVHILYYDPVVAAGDLSMHPLAPVQSGSASSLP